MGIWQIAVQPSDRKQYYVDVDEDDTLKAVFDEISKHQWIDVIYLDIIFQGKAYRYDRHSELTLKSIGMRNRCLLQLVGRMKGGTRITFLTQTIKPSISSLKEQRCERSFTIQHLQ